MIILPNLLCEYEMAGRSGDLRRSASSVEARWAYVMRLIPDCEDATVVHSTDEVPSGAALVAWCDLWGRSFGVEREIVIEANDKRVSHEIEIDLGIALPHAQILSSLSEFETAARRWDDRWVVKHPFGVAGRERVLGSGAPDFRATRWCERQFDRGWTLVFEPWVRDAREFSTHWDIDEDGAEFRGGCGLRTHGDGTFSGVRPGVSVPAEIIDASQLAIERIAALGYRGPVGIDSMTGELDGESVVRPVMEINARWTFGRLALCLDARTDREIVWHHGNRRDDLAIWGDWSASAVRLPTWADPEGASGSWVEVLE